MYKCICKPMIRACTLKNITKIKSTLKPPNLSLYNTYIDTPFLQQISIERQECHLFAQVEIYLCTVLTQDS